ncbi:MAG: hypothetical protein EXS37_13645 [Opitutus sp.]|nr:hypothetical protein [Opitutus sp.]
MNPLRFHTVISVFVLYIAASVARAQVPTTAARTPAPLGLLRPQDTAKPGAAAALVANKFAVDDLSANAAPGASKGKKDDVDVLTLEANKEWSRALRGSPRDVSFVSFQVHASASSIVDIGGARLGPSRSAP